MQFIAYFDCDQMDYIDLRYYRVKIANFDARPELVGREALIEHRSAGVYLTTEYGARVEARSEEGPD